MLKLNNYYIKNEYDKYEAAIIDKAAYFDMNKKMNSPYGVLY